MTVYSVCLKLTAFTNMFAEEEWTDSPLPDGSSHTAQMSPASSKVLRFPPLFKCMLGLSH